MARVWVSIEGRLGFGLWGSLGILGFRIVGLGIDLFKEFWACSGFGLLGWFRVLVRMCIKLNARVLVLEGLMGFGLF